MVEPVEVKRQFTPQALTKPLRFGHAGSLNNDNKQNFRLPVGLRQWTRANRRL
jgi:hypothetical protein